MKLVVGGILIALALAGCSAKQTPASESPFDAEPDSSFDMCATMPGPELAKAINVRVTEAKKDDVMRNTCNYTGMTECTEQETPMPDMCKISISYNRIGWIDLRPEDEVGEPIAGLGEKAYYDRLIGLKVKVGAKGQLLVSSFGRDYDDIKKRGTDVAKAVLPKL